MIERTWYLEGHQPFVELVDKSDDWGISLIWFCTGCGEAYARAVMAKKVWKAVGGTCPFCPGSRWSIPGGVNGLELIGQRLPLEVLLYELWQELCFTESDSHPFSQESF